MINIPGVVVKMKSSIEKCIVVELPDRAIFSFRQLDNRFHTMNISDVK